ncbi:uncharacterized protein LOC108151949 [Drosophila miranda]|uniref:uncharacterized protein LOC108151949 n=1 Tax=Drosophila miranda TaxID=7229 RepID=UPI0007E61C2F|nr:uncharacterized protein LOC108151949 [Drosophila miranda]
MAAAIPMLLDAIFLIPRLFTYGLILLLICIMCFIVVYISHKIYISVYDNLPLSGHQPMPMPMPMGVIRDYIDSPVRHLQSVQRATSRSSAQQTASMYDRSISLQNRSQFIQSTTVRITLSLDPCYLVGIKFDMSPSRRSISFMCSCDREAPVCVCAAVTERPSESVRIIRYYDQLSKISRLKFMLKCSHSPTMPTMPTMLREEQRSDRPGQHHVATEKYPNSGDEQ